MKRALLTAAAGLLAAASAALCVLGALSDRTEIPARRFKASGAEPAAVVPVARPGGTVDINSDEIEELTMLHGVGESLADRMIAERLANGSYHYPEANGSYHYPEDLYAVSGIGANKAAGFADQLDFSWEEP